jgi:hypothetical protein
MTPATGGGETLPLFASRICDRIDADGAVCAEHMCQRHPFYVPAALSQEARRRAVSASVGRVARMHAPHWTIADTHGAGAAAYRAPASAPPAYSEFAAMVLDAVQRLRRWQYYSDAELPPATAGEALDGCHCRYCRSPAEAREERAILRSAPRQRWQAPPALASFASTTE